MLKSKKPKSNDVKLTTRWIKESNAVRVNKVKKVNNTKKVKLTK